MWFYHFKKSKTKKRNHNWNYKVTNINYRALQKNKKLKFKKQGVTQATVQYVKVIGSFWFSVSWSTYMLRWPFHNRKRRENGEKKKEERKERRGKEFINFQKLSLTLNFIFIKYDFTILEYDFCTSSDCPSHTFFFLCT